MHDDLTRQQGYISDMKAHSLFIEDIPMTHRHACMQLNTSTFERIRARINAQIDKQFSPISNTDDETLPCQK